VPQSLASAERRESSQRGRIVPANEPALAALSCDGQVSMATPAPSYQRRFATPSFCGKARATGTPSSCSPRSVRPPNERWHRKRVTTTISTNPLPRTSLWLASGLCFDARGRASPPRHSAADHLWRLAARPTDPARVARRAGTDTIAPPPHRHRAQPLWHVGREQYDLPFSLPCATFPTAKQRGSIIATSGVTPQSRPCK
jgi:hypothetical protein